MNRLPPPGSVTKARPALEQPTAPTWPERHFEMNDERCSPRSRSLGLCVRDTVNLMQRNEGNDELVQVTTGLTRWALGAGGWSGGGRGSATSRPATNADPTAEGANVDEASMILPVEVFSTGTTHPYIYNSQCPRTMSRVSLSRPASVQLKRHGAFVEEAADAVAALGCRA